MNHFVRASDLSDSSLALAIWTMRARSLGDLFAVVQVSLVICPAANYDRAALANPAVVVRCRSLPIGRSTQPSLRSLGPGARPSTAHLRCTSTLTSVPAAALQPLAKASCPLSAAEFAHQVCLESDGGGIRRLALLGHGYRLQRRSAAKRDGAKRRSPWLRPPARSIRRTGWPGRWRRR